jgi:hypothetical protein
VCASVEGLENFYFDSEFAVALSAALPASALGPHGRGCWLEKGYACISGSKGKIQAARTTRGRATPPERPPRHAVTRSVLTRPDGLRC